MSWSERDRPQKPRRNDRIFQHVYPAWDDWDYLEVFFVDCHSDGKRCIWEQIPCTRHERAGDQPFFTNCCIPFAIYNLDLGDKFVVSEHGGGFQRIEDAGGSTFRFSNVDGQYAEDDWKRLFIKMSENRLGEYHSLFLFSIHTQGKDEYSAFYDECVSLNSQTGITFELSHSDD